MTELSITHQISHITHQISHRIEIVNKEDFESTMRQLKPKTGKRSSDDSKKKMKHSPAAEHHQDSTGSDDAVSSERDTVFLKRGDGTRAVSIEFRNDVWTEERRKGLKSIINNFIDGEHTTRNVPADLSEYYVVRFNGRVGYINQDGVMQD